MPTSGSEEYPPHVSHDDYVVVNPDFWDHGVNRDSFQGWSNMSEVSVLFVICLILVLMIVSLVDAG